MRVFLDANILFSASKSQGAVRFIVDELIEQGHECLADSFVVVEARRNLERKGAEAVADLEALLARLKVCLVTAGDLDSADVGWLPEKDRPVLAAAIALRCDALLTEDRRHFGAGFGQRFGGVEIHSPRSLAEALLD